PRRPMPNSTDMTPPPSGRTRRRSSRRTMNKQSSASDQLKARLHADGVRYALASYVDIHGRSKCKVVPIDHLDRMMKGSELFTGAALDGVPQAVNDDEIAAVPDPASMTILPWKPDVAWFASDMWLVGKPFEACSRQILKRAVAAAADMGYIFNLGIETEFFIFKETENGGFEPI